MYRRFVTGPFREEHAVSITTDFPDIDLLSPELFPDPHPVLGRLRREAPVLFSEQLRSWVLTTYADVSAALRDPRLSVVEEMKRLDDLTQADREALRPLRDIFTSWGNRVDPEAHRVFTSLLKKYFTPARVAAQETRIQRILDELLDRGAVDGTVDVVNDVAHPLAMTLMAEILGLPADRETVEWYLERSNEISQLLEMGERDQLFGCQYGMTSLAEFLLPVLRQRRREPGDDLVSVFFRADPTGEHFPDRYVAAQVIMFLVVGYHTTANQLCNGLQILFDNPRERARLVDDFSLMPNAFDEMMRFHGAVASVRRMALEDLTIRDRTIRAGETLVLVLASANRDPETFPEPDVVDLARPGANKQVGFTIGPFSCMGQALARLEGRTFYRTMLTRFPRLRPRSETPDLISFRPFGRELRTLLVDVS